MFDLGLSLFAVISCFIVFVGCEDDVARVIAFLTLLVSVYFFSVDLTVVLLQNT